jgi:hypothetical protein
MSGSNRGRASVRRFWFSVLFVVVALAGAEAAEGASRSGNLCIGQPLPPTTPISPVATGVAFGAYLELWRFPCFTPPPSGAPPSSSDLGAVLRVTPLEPLASPACFRFTFTLNDDPFEWEFNVCVEEGMTSGTAAIFRVLDGTRTPPSVFPGRDDAVAIQADGVTVLSQPAVQDGLPFPSVRFVNVGCRACAVGETVTVRAVAKNPTGEPIIAEARTSVTGPDGAVVVLRGPESIVELGPGETTIPVLEGFVVHDGNLVGFHYFTIVLIDPGTGLPIADPAQIRLFRRIE